MVGNERSNNVIRTEGGVRRFTSLGLEGWFARETSFRGFRGRNYPSLCRATFVVERMTRIWNDPKRLDYLAATWMLAWGLIWFAPWPPGFRSPIFYVFPQTFVGALEGVLVYAGGLTPFFIFALRRRRILRSARV